MLSPPAAELVRALFAAFTARDVEAAIAVADPGFELWPEGTAQHVGRDTPYRGHAGLREYVRDVAQAWDELTVHPGDLRAAGGGVVAFGHVQGRRHGSPDEVEIPVIWVFKVARGRVCSARVVETAAEADHVLAEQRRGGER